MDQLRTFDYLLLSRGRVLDAARTLSPERYTQRFDIGPGDLATTFTHMLISEWYYVERLLERPVPDYEHWEIKDESPLPFGELESKWRTQSEATRAAIEGERDWGRSITYRVKDDDGRLVEATCNAMDMFTQLALHEVHHRAQALNMLRRLGKPVEGDIDFNAMMYERRFVGA